MPKLKFPKLACDLFYTDPSASTRTPILMRIFAPQVQQAHQSVSDRKIANVQRAL